MNRQGTLLFNLGNICQPEPCQGNCNVRLRNALTLHGRRGVWQRSLIDPQMASKPFDVHEEEGAGSCFLEAYGALGSIKERNNGKGNVSLLHSLRSCEQWISWVLGPWMDMLQVPILFPALSWGPHITFRFILEKTINVVPPSPSHLKGILGYFNYRQYEKPFGTFVVWRCIKRHDCVKSYSFHPSVPHVNFLRLKNREY